MSGSPPNQDVFDLRRIRRLVELMNEHELNEIDLRQGEMRVRIRRGGELGSGGPPLRQPLAAPAPAPAPVPSPPPPAPRETEVRVEDEHVVSVKSPMVGTFYSASDPDSPSYVQVGDHVGPETIVCIVEAMKVFNQIQAEVSGKVIAVLVENGEPVEYGQPMFKVDTRQ
jgi:acetyl-CoA carboxylase biotin carboxyl carrier protein